MVFLSFAMDWIFPDWGRLQYGDAIDIVLQILVVDESGVICKSLHRPSRTILVKGVDGQFTSFGVQCFGLGGCESH